MQSASLTNYHFHKTLYDRFRFCHIVPPKATLAGVTLYGKNTQKSQRTYGRSTVDLVFLHLYHLRNVSEEQDF